MAGMRSDEVLKRVRGRVVLDVGCAGQDPSPDWIHGKLRDREGELVGIDIDPERIAALRRHGVNDIQLGDAQTFSLPQRFDTIVAGEVIEHLENPGLFLARAKEHLAENGRIILTTPYPFALVNVLYALIKFPKTCSNPDHAVWLCPQTISVLFARMRLRVLEWTLIEDYPPYAGRRTRALVRVMRALRLPARLRANAMIYVLVPEV